MSKTLSDAAQLTEWYVAKHRKLPWRSKPTPYRVWVSELMLQQTQVATVIPYFVKFLRAFPNVESLARAPIEEVLQQWAGLGYYRRARFLHEAARRIIERGGIRKFPSTAEAWLELPGIGPYTAGAILSIAYEKPEPIVDGNVERVFSRLYCMDHGFWDRAKERIQSAHDEGISPRDFNQALMELGALICVPQQPRCDVCPMQARCAAFQRGEVEHFPKRRIRAEVTHLRETVAWCTSSSDQVLWVQKKGAQGREGLWDLPKIAVRTRGASQHRNAIGSVAYRVTRYRIERTLVLGSGLEKKMISKKTHIQKWMSPEEAQHAGVNAAAKKCIRKIGAGFQKKKADEARARLFQDLPKLPTRGR